MSTTTRTFGFRLERSIPATRDRVFAAWTRSALLARWSAPVGLEIPRGANDLRVGGRWEVAMAPVGGGPEQVAGGEYREIAPPERLSFTHAWLTDPRPVETLVTVELHEDGETTRVVMVQEGFADEWSRDGHEDGWRSCLDALERALR